MIAGIKGRIARLGASRAYIEAGGLIYEVLLPLGALAKLERDGVGSQTELVIYHHFGDPEQKLYGFLSFAERDLFVALQDIKGVGGGLALSLLSHLEPAALLELCARKDVKSLTRIPRVGKTTAETLIFEINRRAQKLSRLIAESPAPARPSGGDQEELALLALQQLGYKESEAIEALRKVAARVDAEQGAGSSVKLSAADWIALSLRTL